MIEQRRLGYLIKSQMKLKILYWNVKQANDNAKRMIIKSLTKSQRAYLVCLQETIQNTSTSLVQSSGMGRFLDQGVVNSMGATSRVLVFRTIGCYKWFAWKMVSAQYRVILKIVMTVFWIFTRMYGPSLRKDKAAFGAKFGLIRELQNDHWCIAKDFKIVKFPRKSNKVNRLSSRPFYLGCVCCRGGGFGCCA